MKDQIEKQAIEEMAKFIKESCAKTPCFQDEKPYTDCDVCAATYLYSAGYRKQSENVIELPCNLNAEIWYIDKNYTIQKAEVSSINIKASSRHIIAMRYVWETEETIKLALAFEHLGVDYWLTKEGAEEALAKMKGGTE